jgi:glutamate 5-kinase
LEGVVLDIDNYNLIVIKIGTNSIIKDNEINKYFFQELVREVNFLKEKNKKIVIVTSGAIGIAKTKLKIQPKNIKEQQGLSAIGQLMLMKEYLNRFELIGINVAQVLVSQRDLMDKNCLENIKNTFDFLFEQNIVPIVNENDVVSTEELQKNGSFSDNDVLSAILTKQLGANLLVMITEKGGIFDESGKIISFLNDTNLVKDLGTKSILGRGGIRTKLNAINIASNAGSDVFVIGPNDLSLFGSEKLGGTIISKKGGF